MLATVHALFVWHTLKTDVAQGAVVSYSSSGEEEGKATIDSNNNVDTSNEIRKSKMSRSSSAVSLRRNNESYSSFVFDPITHLRSTNLIHTMRESGGHPPPATSKSLGKAVFIYNCKN
jgi:hypothetical protein